MPSARPLIVVPVAGGVPLIVVAGLAVAPTYGVIVYALTGPPPEGALQVTVAEPLPAAAVTPVT